MLMKKIKENLNTEIIPYPYIGKLNIAKVLIIPKLIYSITFIKISAKFFIDIDILF